MKLKTNIICILLLLSPILVLAQSKNKKDSVLTTIKEDAPQMFPNIVILATPMYVDISNGSSLGIAGAIDWRAKPKIVAHFDFSYSYAYLGSLEIAGYTPFFINLGADYNYKTSEKQVKRKINLSKKHNLDGSSIEYLAYPRCTELTVLGFRGGLTAGWQPRENVQLDYEVNIKDPMGGGGRIPKTGSAVGGPIANSYKGIYLGVSQTKYINVTATLTPFGEKKVIRRLRYYADLMITPFVYYSPLISSREIGGYISDATFIAVSNISKIPVGIRAGFDVCRNNPTISYGAEAGFRPGVGSGLFLMGKFSFPFYLNYSAYPIEK
ncbi:MAG: hypothetical protein SGJ04_08420 [Bacteroidota bacterium]|nr:hypothetical protein [Bacteroidota bacterium]